MLVDTHCHLMTKEFEPDLDEVIERANRSDIGVMMNVGIDLDTSKQAIAIANMHDGIYASVGVQPNELGNVEPDWEARIRALAAQPKVKAIGETGMDLYHKRTDPELQRAAFRTHLEIAKEFNKPVIIHSRAAGKLVMDVIEEFAQGEQVKGVMHCFTDHEKTLRRALDAGLYISFAGPLTYPISRKSRELVKKVPDARILIETDSPYLGAQPVKHRRNEPTYLRYVATKVAEMRRLSPRDIGRITTLNADNLFGLDVADRSPRIAYGIRSVLYVNMTNRCNCACTFCPRGYDEQNERHYIVKGHYLKLKSEPILEEISEAMGDISPYREVVFCGFGEPTLRLEELKTLAAKIRTQGQRVRLDTNGLGNHHHGRSIVGELAEVIDSISISINAQDAESYNTLCRPVKPDGAYESMIEFIKEARDSIPEVTVTAVSAPGVDMRTIKALSRELKVNFRERPYDEVG